MFSSPPESPLTIHCAPEALPDVLSSRATLDMLAPRQGALNFCRVPDTLSLCPCSRRAQHEHLVDAAPSMHLEQEQSALVWQLHL